MQLHDRLTLDGPRRDSAGNLVASVLAARTGIQDYRGYEVGKPELASVRIYRPAEEVFSRDSMRSFAGAPVTIEHPSDMITPENWKDHAVGEASEEIVRDGEAVRVPFLLRDAGGIAAVEAGKREVSMGYDCILDWTPGTTDAGETYDGVQRGIRINHLAIVDRARGGPTLRIGDGEPPVKKIMLDGLQVDLSDAAAVEAAIAKLQGKVNDGEAGLADTVKAHDKAMATKDAEIDDLKSKVVDQSVIDSRADEKADVVTRAKAILGDALGDTKGKTPAEVRRMAVAKKLGDAAVADKSDDYVDARFDGLKDAAGDPVRGVLTSGPINIGDAKSRADEAWNKRREEMADAYLHTGTKA